jgi:hypothetical protein
LTLISVLPSSSCTKLIPGPPIKPSRIDNTLGKLEQIIKGLSIREGFIGGPGINLVQLEDGSTEIRVNVDNSSIVTDSNMSIAAKNISGGKY